MSDDFFGILKLDVLIVQTIHGLTIYERQFNSTSKDSGLISGFLNALSTMFETLSGNQAGFQSYETEGSVITLHRLQRSDVILISEEDIPENLMKKFIEAHEMIEEELQLSHFEGDHGVDIPDEEIIDDIIERAGIPMTYLWPYLVDNKQLDYVFRMPLADSKYKYYLNLIEEFNISIIDKSEFMIRQLCGYLEEQRIFRREIARCVEFYISYGVICKQPLTN